MPATPYAKLLVSVNGGAATSGGVDAPSAATLQFSAESIVGWTQQQYEIYEYPEGFATPAGWTLRADGVIYYASSATPPLVTLPANAVLWGPWSVRLKINESLDDDDTAVPNLVDETTIVHMASPHALRMVAALEGTQFCTSTTLHKRWVRTLQRSLIAIETLLGSGAAGGSDTELQRNNAGILAGITSWVWNAASSRVRVGSAALELRNPAGTFGYIVTAAALAADRVLNLPLLTGTDTLAVLSLAQTLENKTLASPTITGTVTYQGTKLRILSIPGEAQTTTATTTVIASFDMLDETSATFDFTAHMTGSPAATKGGRWDGKVTYRRTAAGAPTIVGAAEYGTAQEDVAGDDVAFNVSGNTIQVLATAADADDRNWTCELRVHETLATA